MAFPGLLTSQACSLCQNSNFLFSHTVMLKGFSGPLASICQQNSRKSPPPLQIADVFYGCPLLEFDASKMAIEKKGAMPLCLFLHFIE